MNLNAIIDGTLENRITHSINTILEYPTLSSYIGIFLILMLTGFFIWKIFGKKIKSKKFPIKINKIIANTCIILGLSLAMFWVIGLIAYITSHESASYWWTLVGLVSWILIWISYQVWWTAFLPRHVSIRLKPR